MFHRTALTFAALSLTVSILFAEAAAQEGPGGFAAAVMKNDAISHTVLKGVANLDDNTPVTMDTVFHVASLSKQITAAALAMAILDGKASLDDPVSDHIPEAAHYGNKLTIAHLLYFTSGLTEAYDLSRDSGLPWTTQYYFTVDEAIRKSLSVKALQFEPGSQWRYNNINFQLIAEIVERVYNKPFSVVVRERIFQPLGMQSSLIHDDITQVVPGRANGVLERTPQAVEQLRSVGIDVASEGGPILIRRNAPHYGGSGVLTSMSDWMRWQKELISGDIFGERFWKLMFSTKVFEHPKSNDAFGLVHATFEDTAIVWFAGSDIDASSYMLASPQIGVAAACFSNQPGFNCRAQAETLFRKALPHKTIAK